MSIISSSVYIVLFCVFVREGNVLAAAESWGRCYGNRPVANTSPRHQSAQKQHLILYSLFSATKNSKLILTSLSNKKQQQQQSAVQLGYLSGCDYNCFFLNTENMKRFSKAKKKKYGSQMTPCSLYSPLCALLEVVHLGGVTFRTHSFVIKERTDGEISCKDFSFPEKMNG